MTPILESWLSLSVAIVMGVCGTIGMKLSHGLQYRKPTMLSLFFYLISFIALTFALKHIDLSIVYAIWSGVGTVLVAIVGIFYFNEVASMRKAIYLFLIVMGIIGIHVSAYYGS